MADLRRLINQVINVETGKRLTDATQNTADPTPQELDRATQVLFRTTLINSDFKPFASAVETPWLFAIGKDFSCTPPYLVTSSDFNISADWSDLAPASGKICWRADLTDAALKAAMKDLTADPTYHACLWMLPAGEKPVLISQWNIIVHLIAVDPTTAVAGAGIVHATTDWVKASYVPIWGDGAAVRRGKPYDEHYFPDGKWRAFIPTIVEGQPSHVWGDPKD